MIQRRETYVIVGANLAGGRAAETLRQAGFDGRLVLIGAEPDRPYERPPLSKEYLRGEYDETRLFLRPDEYYEEQGIELRLGIRAVGLDAPSRVVALDTGDQVRFDKLLIATGARPRQLNVPGAELEGIHYLRTLREAERIRADLRPGQKVVIIGAGFIGAEVAASCRELGLEVTMLEALAVPLQRALGPEVGQLYGDIHLEHGVDLQTGVGVASFRGNGRVEAAVTTTGREIGCDLVVVGVGVEPVVDWLEGSGVEVENGVLVNEYCETSVPGVYAAGDVANWWHPLFQERYRLEHYDNAQNQGVAAAQNMARQSTVYEPIPYFWSDQYDLHLQYVGHASRWDRIVFRGDLRSKSFSVFYLLEGRVRAALGVNRFKDVNAAKRLIRGQVVVRAETLADEGIDLKALAKR